MAPPILRVEGLKTYFYTKRGVVRAVDGVSFELGRGEVLCLAGESGSGKTVTALSILGLVDPPGEIVGGRIWLDGMSLLDLDLKGLQAVRGRQIAMIFQDPKGSLNPVHSIGDQIIEPMKLHLGLNKEEARERVLGLLERVGISSPEERMKGYPHEFSGGMNQRAMIAVALSCDPEVLIADEPTSALDVTTQNQFLRLLMDLKRERNVSMMLITHDMGIVAETANRIVVMYAGKVMERGMVWDIFENPRHPYTIGLLNCLPELKKRERELTPIPGQTPSLIDPPHGCVFHPRCSFAQDICSQITPPEADVEDSHRSACHFWDEEDVKKASRGARV